MLPDDTREAASRIFNRKQEFLERNYGNYSENLRIIDKAIDSITACFQLNEGTIDEIVFPLLKMFEGMRNKDYKIIDLNIQLLRNESNKLPQHIRSSIDAQIGLLDTCCKNIISYQLAPLAIKNHNAEDSG